MIRVVSRRERRTKRERDTENKLPGERKRGRREEDREVERKCKWKRGSALG